MDMYIIAKLISSDLVLALSSAMLYNMLKDHSTNSQNKIAMGILVRIAGLCVLLLPVLAIALIWVY